MRILATMDYCTPVQTGVSQSGTQWQRNEIIVITNDGDRSDRVAFTAFGNVCVKAASIVPGSTVELRYRMYSEEFTDKNGQQRWGTRLQCYGITPMVAQQTPAQHSPGMQGQYTGNSTQLQSGTWGASQNNTNALVQTRMEKPGDIAPRPDDLPF